MFENEPSWGKVRGPRLSRKPLGKKTLYGLAILAAVVLAVPPVALSNSAPAQAAFAPGGSGLYKGAIDWIEWGARDSGIVNKQQASSIRDIDGQMLTTTCQIDNIVNPIVAYRPGSWIGDSLDNLYNRGGNNTSNQMVYGVRNSVDGGQVSFEVRCAATLKIGSQTPIPVPLGGLVVADAESSGSAEFIQAAPIPSDATSTWRIIERLRAPGCTTSLIAKRTASTLEMRPNAAECAANSSNIGGPMAVAYLDGATSTKITMKGGGKSAVALGVVLEADFGDAPSNYGSAGALFARDWTGGTIAAGTTGTNVSEDAFVPGVPSQPKTRLGDRVDSDIGYQGSPGALGDDEMPLGGRSDEDAIAPLGRLSVVPGQRYQLDVACTGPGHVAGWIDWNVNEKFDIGERSDAVQCTGTSVNLSWTVPADVKNTPGQTKSFLRLRIAADVAGVASPGGMTTSGEVEDHALQLSTPTLTIQKNISTRVAAADQFALSLRSEGQLLGSATTSGAALGLQTAAVGPLNVTPGKSYDFSEAMAAGSASPLGEYSSNHQCTASYPNGSSQTLIGTTTGATGNITIPAIVAGQGAPAISCLFTNDPKAASLTVEKKWVVNGTAYNHTNRPAGLDAQLTLARNGPATNHDWQVEKTGYASGQTVVVDEKTTISSAMPGCTVTGQRLTTAGGVDAALPHGLLLKAGANTATVTNSVQCTSELTLAKQVVGGTADPSSWTLSAYPATGNGNAIFSGSTGVKQAVTAGQTLQLAESGGSPLYVQDDSRTSEEAALAPRSSGSWTCTAYDKGGSPAPGVLGARAGTNGTVTAPLGSKVSCTAVNRTAQLSILKFVENTNGTGSSQSSDWQLTAAPHGGVPGLGTGTVNGDEQVTVDNTLQVRPGHKYVLSEHGSVGGYTQVALQRFTGTDPTNTGQLANAANWSAVAADSTVAVAAGRSEVYRFVNRDAVRFALPLTGGSGAQPFLVGGGVVVALALGAAAMAAHRRRSHS